jgi:hypothetical protein
LYGRRLYDPSFLVASIHEGVPDHCDSQQLSKGPTFLAIDKAGKRLFFRMCFRAPADRYIDFFAYEGEHTLSGNSRFASVIETFVPPGIAGTLDALRDELSK